MRHQTCLILITLLIFTVVGCTTQPTPASPQGSNAPASATTAPQAPKRVIAAVMSEPSSLSWKLSAGDNVRAGQDTLEPLIHVGLVAYDNQGQLFPVLAEAVPSVDNGLWKVFPDGRMETTWKLRPNARWHDGTDLTSADFVFTDSVQRDPALPIFRDARFAYLDTVEAPDPRTITVKWNRPFIDADQLFSTDFGLVLPRHLLEAPYRENKAGLVDLPYWAEQFVGTGPFKVREFARGSHVLLEANDQYVLGRPRLDSIEVRFLIDSNALVANVLAGAVELPLGRNLSVDQGLLLRSQWPAGRVEIVSTNLTRVYPQFIDPRPEVILDLRFRRALLHAIDRQEMTETLLSGVTPPAHSYLNPGQPQYREIEERQVVRYEHDLRRAAQLIEEIGYRKGPDGMYRDVAGAPLTVDLQVSASQEINVKSAYAVSDYWQRAGVGANTIVEPQQMTGDQRREFIAARPAFMLTRRSSDVAGLDYFPSSQTPLPSNRFVGTNYSRYQNPEFDSLLDRYFTTIPRAERLTILGQIIHHMTDQLPLFPLYYGAEPAAISNRLVNVGPRVGNALQSWNAHLWDVTPLISNLSPPISAG